MAGKVGAHDVGAGLRVLVLLDQVGEGLVHELLKLPPFLLGQLAHSGQGLGIDLGSKFLTDLGHGGHP